MGDNNGNNAGGGGFSRSPSTGLWTALKGRVADGLLGGGRSERAAQTMVQEDRGAAAGPTQSSAKDGRAAGFAREVMNSGGAGSGVALYFPDPAFVPALGVEAGWNVRCDANVPYTVNRDGLVELFELLATRSGSLGAASIVSASESGGAARLILGGAGWTDGAGLITSVVFTHRNAFTNTAPKLRVTMRAVLETGEVFEMDTVRATPPTNDPRRLLLTAYTGPGKLLRPAWMGLNAASAIILDVDGLGGGARVDGEPLDVNHELTPVLRARYGI